MRRALLRFLRFLGVIVEEISREQAAAEILGREFKVRITIEVHHE